MKNYKYYQVKADIVGEDADRFERICEQKSKRKGVLLRELILKFLALVEKDLYHEDREVDEFAASDEGLDWGDVGDVIMEKTLRKREFIPKKDR